MYFTDQGIEELAQRRADDEVSLGWLAERLREFVDQSPEFDSHGSNAPPSSRICHLTVQSSG